MIVKKIRAMVKEGQEIPKPFSKGGCMVKKYDIKNGETYLYYNFSNNNEPKKTYTKKVSGNEFEKAYQELIDNKSIDRKWYKISFPEIDKTSPCNFTTIGGIFELIKVARYNKGKYTFVEGEK